MLGTVSQRRWPVTPTGGTAIQSTPFLADADGGWRHAPIRLRSVAFYSRQASAFPAPASSRWHHDSSWQLPVTLRVTDNSTGVGSHFELRTYTLTVGPPPSVSIAVSPASVSEDGTTNLTPPIPPRSLSLTSPTTVNITTSGTAGAVSNYAGGIATNRHRPGTFTPPRPSPSAWSTARSSPTRRSPSSSPPAPALHGGAPDSHNHHSTRRRASCVHRGVADHGHRGQRTRTWSTPVTWTGARSAISISCTIGGTPPTAPIRDHRVAVDHPTPATPPAIRQPRRCRLGADRTVPDPQRGRLHRRRAEQRHRVPITNDDLPEPRDQRRHRERGQFRHDQLHVLRQPPAPAGPAASASISAPPTVPPRRASSYVAQSLTGQTILAGSSTYTFTVQANGDTPLTNRADLRQCHQRGRWPDGQGLGTIVNDDPLPTSRVTTSPSPGQQRGR